LQLAAAMVDMGLVLKINSGVHWVGKGARKLRFLLAGQSRQAANKVSRSAFWGGWFAHLFSLFLFTKSRGCSAWIQVVSDRWRISFLTDKAASVVLRLLRKSYL